MARRLWAARASEIGPGERIRLELGGLKLGIFRLSDGFFALEDKCPHQQGPVCSGNLFREITATVGEDGKVQEHYARDEADVVACPMHGWEFEVRTGECLANRRRKVQRFPVEVDGEDLYVLLPGG